MDAPNRGSVKCNQIKNTRFMLYSAHIQAAGALPGWRQDERANGSKTGFATIQRLRALAAGPAVLAWGHGHQACGVPRRCRCVPVNSDGTGDSASECGTSDPTLSAIRWPHVDPNVKAFRKTPTNCWGNGQKRTWRPVHRPHFGGASTGGASLEVASNVADGTPGHRLCRRGVSEQPDPAEASYLSGLCR